MAPIRPIEGPARKCPEEAPTYSTKGVEEWLASIDPLLLDAGSQFDDIHPEEESVIGSKQGSKSLRPSSRVEKRKPRQSTFSTRCSWLRDAMNRTGGAIRGDAEKDRNATEESFMELDSAHLQFPVPSTIPEGTAMAMETQSKEKDTNMSDDKPQEQPKAQGRHVLLQSMAKDVAVLAASVVTIRLAVFGISSLSDAIRDSPPLPSISPQKLDDDAISVLQLDG